MNCQRCGHAADQHDAVSRRSSSNITRCHVRVLTDWDESRRAFIGERPCACTGYAPPLKTRMNGCPHERVKNCPNCVHCGQVTEDAERHGHTDD